MMTITAPNQRSPPIPSPILSPPMNVSTFDSWKTSYTTTDDNTFHTSDEPRRVYWNLSSSDTFDSNEPRYPSIASGLSSTTPPSPPRKIKRKLEVGMSFRKKEGECRSTSAKPADRRSTQQKIFQVHLLITKL